MIEEIINQGAMVTLPDIVGWTALHVACFYKRADVILLLLKNGANLLSQDRDKVLSCDLVIDDPDCVEVIANYLTLLETKKINNNKISSNNFSKSLSLNDNQLISPGREIDFLKDNHMRAILPKKKHRDKDKKNMSFSEKNLVQIAQIEKNQQIRNKYKFIPKKHTFCNVLKKSLKMSESQHQLNNLIKQDVKPIESEKLDWKANTLDKKKTWDIIFPVENQLNKNRNSLNIIQNSIAVKEDINLKSSYDFFYKPTLDEDKMLDENVAFSNTFKCSISVPKVFPKTKNLLVLDNAYDEEKRKHQEKNENDLRNAEIEDLGNDYIQTQPNHEFAKFLETQNSEDSFIFDYDQSIFEDLEDEKPTYDQEIKKNNKINNGGRLGKIQNAKKMRNKSLVEFPNLNDSNIKDNEINMDQFTKSNK